MKKIFAMAAVAIIIAMSAQAQKIQTVDAKGNAIPLVSVLTDDGLIIGTTDLNGVLPDVKGAKTITLTHVAYKPQQVTVAALADGRVTMEDLDYDLSEIVVKPKPYIYVQTYYRFYAFINDSLRFYQAGIMPNAYDIKKKKVEMGSHNNSMGDFYPSMGIGVTWGARVMEYHAGKIRPLMSNKMKPGGELSKKYSLTLKNEGKGRQRIQNPEGTLGYIVTEGGKTRITFNASKAQMYRNKAQKQNKMLKKRQEVEYAYRYTNISKVDEEGNSNIEDFVMDTNHWEWTRNKGHYKMIIECYTVDRGYMDKKEWSIKKKELKSEHKALMSLNRLESYATSHNIPALSPTIRRAIERLGKK